MTDAEQFESLQAAVATGDKVALADAFALCRDRLRRIVEFRLDPRLAGRVDADDLLQEAFLNACQRLQHFAERQSEEGGMSLFVWLRLLVNQTLVDFHRRHLGAQQRDAGREAPLARGAAATATGVSLAHVLVGRLTSPSGAAMRAELADQLRVAIEEMGELDQEIIALRHYEELSNTEAAEVLGVQPKAASIRYIRAIRRLKEILVRFPGFNP